MKRREWFRRGGVVHMIEDEMRAVWRPDDGKPELVIPLSRLEGCETPDDVNEVIRECAMECAGKEAR